MSISFRSADPDQLLKSLNRAIDNHQQGRSGDRIDTWRYVQHQGHYFYTHTSQNWRDKAWLRADLQQGQLVFVVRPVQNVGLTRDVYAYYVGHLAETFIRHFSRQWSTAQTTSDPSSDDANF